MSKVDWFAAPKTETASRAGDVLRSALLVVITWVQAMLVTTIVYIIVGVDVMGGKRAPDPFSSELLWLIFILASLEPLIVMLHPPSLRWKKIFWLQLGLFFCLFTVGGIDAEIEFWLGTSIVSWLIILICTLVSTMVIPAVYGKVVYYEAKPEEAA